MNKSQMQRFSFCFISKAFCIIVGIWGLRTAVLKGQMHWKLDLCIKREDRMSNLKLAISMVLKSWTLYITRGRGVPWHPQPLPLSALAPVWRLTYIKGAPTPHPHSKGRRGRRGRVAIPRIRSSSDADAAETGYQEFVCRAITRDSEKKRQSVSQSVTDHRVYYVNVTVSNHHLVYEYYWANLQKFPKSKNILMGTLRMKAAILPCLNKTP